MLQLPHHQDLNMPPNFPMSNDSGFHETDSPKAPPPHHDSGSPDPGYAEMGGSSPDSLMDSGNAGEHDNHDKILSNPINTRNDIGISNQEMVTMSTKEINKFFKKSEIPKELQKELKQERRTLKNRGYAAICRERKEKQREDEERTIKKKIDLLKHNFKLKLCEIKEAKREKEKLNLSYKYVCKETEHEIYLMKIEEDNAKQGQELGVRNLLANRTEIKWEKVK